MSERKNLGPIRLTSHPDADAKTIPIKWGAKDPHERGPVIATLTDPSHRNCIGAHSGSYAVYRALAIAAKALPSDHKADLTNTSPVDQGVGVTIVFVDPAGQVRGGTSALGMVLPTVPAGGRGPIATHTPRQLPDDWTLQTYLTPLAPQDPPTFD